MFYIVYDSNQILDFQLSLFISVREYYGMVEKGILIAIEGTDGSGKSTQSDLLAEYLRGIGREVVHTREPTYGRIGKLLLDYYIKDEDIPIIDALLFTADRAEHIEKVIKPALKEGKIVITDRYYYSTMAFQSTAGGLPLEWLIEMSKFFPKPDIAIFYDLRPEEAMKRIIKREGDETEIKFEKHEMIIKIREGFMDLAKRFDEMVIVDASGDIDSIHKETLETLKKRLGL